MVILVLRHAQKLRKELHSVVTDSAEQQCSNLMITLKTRIALVRQFDQVSDLSAPVGRVLAYRGSDG